MALNKFIIIIIIIITIIIIIITIIIIICLSRISGGVKLVTSQVVQRAWPIIHAYMRG